MQPSFTPTPLAGRSGVGRFGALSTALGRPGGRRSVSVLALVLFLAGVVMFAYPVGTDFAAGLKQGQLANQLTDKSYRDAYEQRTIEVGEGLTRLEVPKIGLDVNVVEGTTASALRAGAGHYVDTPLPGEAGNVGIAGHRTTYGRPFNRLDEVRPGDKVYLTTPFATFTYTVVPQFDGHENPWPTSPQDVGVLAGDPSQKLLTLTTCHPKGSARQRLILRAELTETDAPTGAGKAA